jgi:hypothetical protein
MLHLVLFIKVHDLVVCAYTSSGYTCTHHDIAMIAAMLAWLKETLVSEYQEHLWMSDIPLKDRETIGMTLLLCISSLAKYILTTTW